MVPLSRRDQRGTQLLELAIVIPVLMTLVFGIVEFGMVMKNYVTLANSSRAGARVGATSGSHVDAADYHILQAVIGGSDQTLSNVQTVVVFKAESADGSIPVTCGSNGTYHSADGLCNVYSGDYLRGNLNESNKHKFGGCNEVAEPNTDRYWSPSKREDNPDAVGGLANLDYVGVYIKYDHTYITGLFGKSLSMHTQHVVRLAPNWSGDNYC